MEIKEKEFETKDSIWSKINKYFWYLFIIWLAVCYSSNINSAETSIDKLVVIGEMVALASFIYIGKFCIKQ